MTGLVAHIRRMQAEVLGLNRRNQEYMVRLNSRPLVALVDNKVRTKELLDSVGLPVPATYARYQTLQDLARLESDLAPRQACVLKPSHGAGGEGVLVLHRDPTNAWQRANGTVLDSRDLQVHASDILAGAFALARHRDEVLVEERLFCHPALEPFSPGGVPDVRLIVVHGIPIMAMLRLPTRASDGRANLHVGGIGVGLDLASGTPVHAICDDRSITEHPDTQMALHQLRIPDWDHIVTIAAQSFDAIRLGYFGIDIVVDAQRGPVVLELNARPGLAIQLANQRGLRPLLEQAEQLANQSASVGDRVAHGLRIGRAA